MTNPRTIPAVLTVTTVVALTAAASASAHANPAPPPADAGLAVSSDTLVINEVQPSHIFGSDDEFVELRNISDQTLDLSDLDILTCDSTGSPSLAATLPNIQMQPGQFYLIAGLGYARVGGGSPDQFYSVDVPDDGGWAIFDPFSGVVDSVGLGDHDCVEGTGSEPWAPQCDWDAGEAATRDAAGTDTNQNSVDFTCQPATPTGS